MIATASAARQAHDLAPWRGVHRRPLSSSIESTTGIGCSHLRRNRPLTFHGALSWLPSWAAIEAVEAVMRLDRHPAVGLDLVRPKAPGHRRQGCRSGSARSTRRAGRRHRRGFRNVSCPCDSVSRCAARPRRRCMVTSAVLILIPRRITHRSASPPRPRRPADEPAARSPLRSGRRPRRRSPGGVCALSPAPSNRTDPSCRAPPPAGPGCAAWCGAASSARPDHRATCRRSTSRLVPNASELIFVSPQKVRKNFKNC